MRDFLLILWVFMSKYNITLEDKTATKQLVRRNNHVLMEVFEKLDFSPMELKQLNIIRMYLKAFYTFVFLYR